MKPVMPPPPPAWSPLPSAAELARYEIWDSYFTPPRGAASMSAIEALLPLLERCALRKLCYFAETGLGSGQSGSKKREPALAPDAPLQRWPDRMMAFLTVSGRDVAGSLAALDHWMRDGTMRGVYLPGSAPEGMNCLHPNLEPLVARVAELGGVIMAHTWFKTNEPPDGFASTPADLAELAARFPGQTFLCAHAGGNWELGLRAVRASPNILVETSGFDATAGFIEMAVRELGAERVVFGSHLPSRSIGTELGKVLFAHITEEEKRLILGANFRRVLGAG